MRRHPYLYLSASAVNSPLNSFSEQPKLYKLASCHLNSSMQQTHLGHCLKLTFRKNIL